jgi:hypothetical protein
MYCAIVNPGCYARAEYRLPEVGAEVPPLDLARAHQDGQGIPADGAVPVRRLRSRVVLPGACYQRNRQPDFGPEGPLPIPNDWVQNLRMRYLAGEWDYWRQELVTFLNAAGQLETRHNAPIPIGARIELMAGEFADMVATVTGKKGKRGKTIIFKVKGENRYGELHISDVRPAWEWHKEATAA